MKEIFAQMQLNLCTDEENFCMDIVKRIHVWRKFFERMWLNGWTANKNFWTNKVEQINDWRKHFLKDEWLKKIIICERMRSIGQTTEENYNVILITILEQAPLQLYKLRMNDSIIF